MGLVEISTVPNRPFEARDDQNFFGPYQLGSKALVKCFQCRQNHFGAMKASHSRKSLKLGPKMVFCRNFCTPEFDFFGARWSKFFRPSPKKSQSPQKSFWVTPISFLGSVGLLEPKIADFRPKRPKTAFFRRKKIDLCAYYVCKYFFLGVGCFGR